ncbi:hypothetical protein [Celeribacter indicus]|nr:hypothetical protein [Celeribacter indicus]SDW28662.1 hypothetical protein SAMN05443573_102258 [Celeribacter indicus]
MAKDDEDIERRLKERVMDEFWRKVSAAKKQYGQHFIQRLIILSVRVMNEGNEVVRASYVDRIYSVVLLAKNGDAFLQSPYADALFALLRHYRQRRSVH